VPDLILNKKNETFIQIDCEPSIAQELSGFFTFYVPGYRFMPAYKNRLWDGKIRLYNTKNNTIYHGLVPYIQKFCVDRNYSLEISPFVNSTRNISLVEAKDFISTLYLPFEPRDYQLNSFVHAIRNKRILILSPTASGKSLIIYMILRYLQHLNYKKGLLIVPTTSLVEQMFTDFKSYGYDSDMYCHRQYSGKEKHTNSFLTITTWQSIYKNPSEYFEQFDFVMGDEAHQFKSKSLTTILSGCINASYRIGTTGTLDGTQTHKLVLEGLFGPEYKATTSKELMDKNQLANLKIKCLILKHSEEVCKLARKWDYQTEIDYIVSSNVRNKFIRNLTLSLEGNTLVLFQFVEKHGKDLYAEIKNNAKNKPVFFIHGNTDTEFREQVRAITDFNNKNIITLSFDDYEIMIDENEFVPLYNLSQKKAKDITENDDIDTYILINKIKASTSKGHIVWTNKK
jgi:superfamily II DNA or RNA helicase